MQVMPTRQQRVIQSGEQLKRLAIIREHFRYTVFRQDQLNGSLHTPNKRLNMGQGQFYGRGGEQTLIRAPAKAAGHRAQAALAQRLGSAVAERKHAPPTRPEERRGGKEARSGEG